MPKTVADQLREMGLTDEAIGRAVVNGKPLAMVNGGTRIKSRLPDGMNKTEALYAAELDWRQRHGEIVAWHFEPIRLRLAHRTTYTPDFLLVFKDGRLQFVEIKGFLRDDAAIKFKLAREKYPFFGFTMLRRVRRQWIEVNL